MSCKDCPYYWREVEWDGSLGGDDGEWVFVEDYPRCHWESRCPGDVPPCEEDE